jgi:hypothetical protein
VPAAQARLQADENIGRAAAPLSPQEVGSRPGGAALVGFHIRHMTGNIDRLPTYARGEALTDAHWAARWGGRLREPSRRFHRAHFGGGRGD